MGSDNNSDSVSTQSIRCQVEEPRKEWPFVYRCRNSAIRKISLPSFAPMKVKPFDDMKLCNYHANCFKAEFPELSYVVKDLDALPVN